MNVKVQVVNAFVDKGKGGNPAGVVLDADNFSQSQKLHIAKEVGLSETAFVSKSETADFKLEFFTPTRQIAHCGHATVATFSYLEQLGKVPKQNSSKETIDGNRDIKLVEGLAFMEQRAPKYGELTLVKDFILESLGLDASDLMSHAALQYVNTGNAFFVIPVKNENILGHISPKQELIQQLSEAFDLVGFYPFAIDMDEPMFDATARMFAPRYGIDEEAATGMAAGPLACYLHDILGLKKERFKIRQGQFMRPPSPSSIIVDLKIEQGKILSLMAGGKGVVSKELEITL
ncbi:MULTISPECIES: PhzF family phenazine biosynthesis protein [Flavobacteriaceae]|uniref:PhzF family phenazine biosynthesis protein n=1 Tax=Flavobacteriaceae TaxID=49546 RepID=UPI00234AB9E8|nr:PhzF family phenazine biosynthesis protein [Muricauda sp. SP22]MDC6362621.1 PhzF family phenazine biosynthesis protein [Muricauda sp. SP22]